MMTKQIDKFRNDYLSWSLAERDAEKRGEERKAIATAKIMLSDNMPINLKYILGILNSKTTDFYYEFINPEKGEGLAEVKREHIAQLLIPNATKEQQNEIIALVDKILEAKKVAVSTDSTTVDTTEWEKQIDLLVYHLYGLTYEEAMIV